jgi:hypothetical protein
MILGESSCIHDFFVSDASISALQTSELYQYLLTTYFHTGWCICGAWRFKGAEDSLSVERFEFPQKA